MCGIAGIWNRNGKPIVESMLHGMISTMTHRGRDGSGTFVDGDFGLAHQRMSIIDLSGGGHQPMSTNDGMYHINFNGEIHNYIELRCELVKAGYKFRSSSDTEVALAAYATWGEKCFNRFNGMWAIAIWDSVLKELTLCRDRFGIKPLLYSIRDGRLAFASEVKAIIHAFPIEREPDYTRMYGYLKNGETNMGETTFYSNVKALLPGRLMKVTESSIDQQNYWDFSPGTELSREDAEEQFRWLMIDATRLRLRSDAPVAVWLSGGLDSSLITRIMRKLVDQPLHCYSLRYDNWHYDESEYAAVVADDPDHYDLQWVTPNDTGIFDKIRNIVRCHDAPTPMRGRYAMWQLAQETACNEKVVLTGDGCDELLGGYGIYAVPYLLDRVRNLRAHRTDKLSILSEFSGLNDSHPGSSLHALKMLATPLLYRLGIEKPILNHITTKSFRKQYGYADPSEHMAGWACRKIDRPYRSALNNALWHEFTYRGLPEMLHGNDAISMAHTLETRSPFLDHRVVEFCFSLHYSEKIRDGYRKSLLRRAFADMLPPKVRDRRVKRGFESPVAEWLRRSRDLKAVSELLMDGACVRDGIFDPRRVQKRIKAIESGVDKKSGVKLWNWVNMEWWYQMNIDKG